MNRRVWQICAIAAGGALLSGCRTTMTLGGAAMAETRPNPAYESICLVITDAKNVHNEAKGLGFSFAPEEYFEATLRGELSSYFIVNTGSDCSPNDLQITASLKSLYFLGLGGSAGPFPLSEAESNATVELISNRPNQIQTVIEEQSNSYKAVEFSGPRVVMVVTARAAISDAVNRSIRRLVCQRGLAECPAQITEQRRIEGAMLEYKRIEKVGKPKMLYTIFGYTFESWI